MAGVRVEVEIKFWMGVRVRFWDEGRAWDRLGIGFRNRCQGRVEIRISVGFCDGVGIWFQSRGQGLVSALNPETQPLSQNLTPISKLDPYQNLTLKPDTVSRPKTQL